MMAAASTALMFGFHLWLDVGLERNLEIEARDLDELHFWPFEIFQNHASGCLYSAEYRPVA
jgi:hypothetical protein